MYIRMYVTYVCTYVIKCVFDYVAFLDVQRLKLDQLAGHILRVLEREDKPVLLQLLCTEYSNLLMKDVLMRPSVCLPPSMWHGMYVCMYVL